jgi:hypothetical protein
VPKTALLAGYCFSTRVLLRTTAPLAYPSYQAATTAQVVGQDCPLLLFPLYDSRRILCSAVEIVKAPSLPVCTERDEHFIEYFSYKSRFYSGFLCAKQVPEPLILDLIGLEQLEQIVPRAARTIETLFNCFTYEFWELDGTANGICRFTKERPNNEEVSEKDIVGGMLMCPETLSLMWVMNHRDYAASVDSGSLRRIPPFLAMSLANSFVYTTVDKDLEQTRMEMKSLVAILESAEVLMGHFDIARLTGAMISNGAQLTHADRCS